VESLAPIRNLNARRQERQGFKGRNARRTGRSFVHCFKSCFGLRALSDPENVPSRGRDTHGERAAAEDLLAEYFKVYDAVQEFDRRLITGRLGVTLSLAAIAGALRGTLRLFLVAALSGLGSGIEGVYKRYQMRSYVRCARSSHLL